VILLPAAALPRAGQVSFDWAHWGMMVFAAGAEPHQRFYHYEKCIFTPGLREGLFLKRKK